MLTCLIATEQYDDEWAATNIDTMIHDFIKGHFALCVDQVNMSAWWWIERPCKTDEFYEIFAPTEDHETDISHCLHGLVSITELHNVCL